MSLTLEHVDLEDVHRARLRAFWIGFGQPVRSNTRYPGQQASQIEPPDRVPSSSPGKGVAFPAGLPGKLHVLAAPGRGWAIFHSPSLTLMRLDELSGPIVQDWVSTGSPADQIALRHSVEIEDVEELFHRLNRIVSARLPVIETHPPPSTLETLILDVSGACNLGCRYCYTRTGSLPNEKAKMTAETVMMALNRVFNRYSEVKKIMFFGGEPTLNPTAIQVGCEHVLQLHQQGSLSMLPLLGLVSNGLVLSEKMIGIIQRFGLGVTISLDGPPDLHNYLRPVKDGRPSYATIAGNIRRLQQATGGRQPAAIEVTYTAAHLAGGVTLKDLMDYFESQFGIVNIHVAPVALQPGVDNNLRIEQLDGEMLRDLAGDVVESWVTSRPRQLQSVWQCIIPFISHRARLHHCGGALTELAISPSGDLYPCQTLITDEFYMGSVTDPEVFDSLRFQEVQNRISASSKANIEPCRHCWMSGLCLICLGNFYIENGTLDTVSEVACSMNREVATSTLLALSRIHADPSAWDQLCSMMAAGFFARG